MRSQTYIFTGPTISETEARSYLDANYLPPVSQGDIISLLKSRPKIIGIIDGYFERIPAVWHKEIMFAMSKGIHVVGASSMGALRAVELSPFGMVGVGEIFEWYRDGVIEGDDEVAVAHAPTEFKFRAISEVMVNIRKTLQVACSEGVISQTILERLIAIGKEIYYYDRSYQSIFDKAVECGIPIQEIVQLQKYLVDHTIDQKKKDAIEALDYIKELEKSGHTIKTDFELQRTIHFERFIDRDCTLTNEEGIQLTHEELVNNARLECDNFMDIMYRATMESIACQLARHLGISVSDDELQEYAEHFRKMFHLHTADATFEWFKRNHMIEEDFEQFIKERVLIEKTQSFFMELDNRTLLNELRMRGKYEKLARTAFDKARVTMDLPTSGKDMPDEEHLYAYYFERKKMPVPENIAEYAARLGFEDESSFLTEVGKFFLYYSKNEVSQRKAQKDRKRRNDTKKMSEKQEQNDKSKI